MQRVRVKLRRLKNGHGTERTDKMKFKFFACMIIFLVGIQSIIQGVSAVDTQRSVVVLLHGLGRSPGSMDRMADALEEAGYTVLNLGYPSTEYPVEFLALDYVWPEIQHCMDSGFEQVHVVAHSLGGIVVRQLQASGMPIPFGRIVMLGPPNGGSEVVDKLGELSLFEWLFGPAGLQLGTTGDSVPVALGSTNLEVGIIAGERTVNPFLSVMIPGDDDGKVSIENAKLQGMKDFIVIKATHPFMPLNQEVIDQTLNFLQYGHFKREEKK